MGRKFGWHSGTMYAQEARIRGDLYIQDSLIFGDVSFGVLSVSGRIATASESGTAITVSASYAYGQGLEFRWDLTDWTGVGSSFDGMYLRAEAKTNTAAGKSLRGTQIYGTCNNVTMTTGSLWGTLTYAYVKGTGAVTINNIYAGQFECSWDASRTADCTVTTESAVILAKYTAGRVADYTKLHGIIVRFGEMDGDSQVFGKGLFIEDDAGMSGTSTLTTGIDLEIGCTTGISLGGTLTTGLVMSGTVTTGISFTGAVTTGITFASSTLSPGSSGGVSGIAFDVGSRTTEATVTFAGSDGIENFEPLQMKVDFVGTNPASVSKVNMIYQQLTHDTTDMANLRLKCADFTISVNKNVQDVYAYQGEVSFGAGTVTASGEVAVVGLVLDGGAGTLTGTSMRVLNLTARGASLPANASGLYIQCENSCTLTDGIRIQTQSSGTITNAVLFGNTSGTSNTCPTNMFKVPAIGSGFVSAYTAEEAPTGKLQIDVGGATRYIAFWD